MEAMNFKQLTHKGIRLDILIVLLLMLVIGFAWRGILSITFQGEGFIYFDEGTYAYNLKAPFDIENYLPFHEDLSARISTHVLSRIFLDNPFGYFAFMFTEMLLTNLAMYLLVRVMTGNRLAASLGTIFFGINYIANANMFAGGGYQYFTQRGVLLLPAILSLVLLVKYLQTRLLGYYFISLLVYLFTVVFGFYTTDFLPVMLLFPLVFIAVNINQGWRFFMETFWVPLPFLIGNYYLIKSAPSLNHASDLPFLTVFFQRMTDFQSALAGISQQLAVLTLPFLLDSNLLNQIKGFLIKPPLGIRVYYQFSNSQHLVIIEAVSIALVLTAFVYLWRLKPNWRVATLTSLLGFLAMLYLNVFLNAEQSLNTLESSRYFYYPYSMGALFWGLFFAGVISERRDSVKKIFVVILLIWIGYNVYAIEALFAREGWRFKANREMLAKIKEISPALKSNPYYLYFPGSLNTFGSGGLQFAQRFYGHPKSAYDFEEPDLHKLIKQDVKPEDIFVFRFDHRTRNVFNETEKWRNELEVLNDAKKY